MNARPWILATLALGACSRQVTAPPPVAAPPDPRPAAWKWHDEEEWTVSQIVATIAAMSGPAETRSQQVAIRVQPGMPIKGPDAWLKPRTVTLSIGSDARPFNVELVDHVFAPLAYRGIAEAMRRGVAGAERHDDLADQVLLKALLDARAISIEKENARVAAELAANPLDARAHERAALVLAALALREEAGSYSDIRSLLVRMTAHLAIAGASEGAEPGLAGRFARIALLALVQREADALALVKAELSRPGPTVTGWLRLLELRITGDWRKVSRPQSLAERLEYARQRSTRVSHEVAMWDPGFGNPPDLPDWGRMSMSWARGKDQSVPECGALGSSLVPLEEMEVAAVAQARGWTVPSGSPEAHVLEAVRRQDALEPIDDATWRDRLERHLISAIHSQQYCVGYVYGLTEQRVAFDGFVREHYARLEAFPLLAPDLKDDPRGGDAGFKSAAAFVERHPERVPPARWLELRADTRFPSLKSALPGENLWFVPAIPRGTAFDVDHRLHKLRSLIALNVDQKAKLRAIAPYDYWVVWSHIWTLGNRMPIPDLMIREAGELMDYDARMAFVLAFTWEGDFENYRIAGARLCRVDAASWPSYVWKLAEFGHDDATYAAYQEMLKHPYNEVVLANTLGWLIDYEFEHGRKDEALRLARRAAATRSATGLSLLSRQLEMRGDLTGAFALVREIQEHYNDRTSMVAFYLRHREQVPDSISRHVAPVLADMFPDGLESVAVGSLSGAPRQGVRVIGPSKDSPNRLESIGIENDAVIVGMNGTRVRNREQYFCLRLAAPTPQIDAIVWQNGQYVERRYAYKDRLLNADVETYAR